MPNPRQKKPITLDKAKAFVQDSRAYVKDKMKQVSDFENRMQQKAYAQTAAESKRKAAKRAITPKLRMSRSLGK